MKLEINEKNTGDGLAKYYATWTRQEFRGLLYNIQNGRIKKDGHYYKRDYENFQHWIKSMYNTLTIRFDVDTVEITDERDTVLRMLKTLPANKFKTFAEATFDVYTNLENNVEITFEG